MQPNRRNIVQMLLLGRQHVRSDQGTSRTGPPFVPVDDEFRSNLLRESFQVKAHLSQARASGFNYLPTMAEVTLIDKALAKSHRPQELFSPSTCPIVGITGPGRLLISVEEHGIMALEHKIQYGTSQVMLKELSTVKRISPYRVSGARGYELGLLREELRDGLSEIKVRLFRYEAGLQSIAKAYFQNLVEWLRGPVLEFHEYAEGVTVARLSNVREQDLDTIANFPAARQVGKIAKFGTARKAGVTRSAERADFNPPVPHEDYPIVGLVDSGIASGHPHLEIWVHSRSEWIPNNDANSSHGTFVAGLLVNSRALNAGDARFPNNQCKILDVVAVDQEIHEFQLLQILRHELGLNRAVKVWNLSLNFEDQVCSTFEVSDVAAGLDALQREFGVVFVIAAGNINCPTRYRGWPHAASDDDLRICAPADSVYGLTVASLAASEHSETLVRAEEPSPFSRHGPGPMYIPKPELSHYGGNFCPKNLTDGVGVRSFTVDGAIAEDIGTSFSTPLVSGTLARLFHELLETEGDDEEWPVTSNLLLAKTLLIHSASLGEHSLDAHNSRYRGFGRPPQVADILTCGDSEITMVVQGDIGYQQCIEAANFPMPACLTTAGLFKGEISMTLLYEPPLDASFGAEYCQVNLDAHLGTYNFNSTKGKKEFKGRVPIEPKHGAAYEAALVEHGFKWSPLKVYRKRFPQGIRFDSWTLMIDMTTRANFRFPNLDWRQSFVVVITLRGESGQPVFNDSIEAMRSLGWARRDVRTRSNVRLRP